MKKDKFTEKELFELLWQKAEEIEKIPGAREINSDFKLPDYEVFKSCFGNFRKSNKLKKLVVKFSELNRKNICFCHDCPQNENKCGKNILDCKAKLTEYQLRLYFDLFNKLIS